MVTFGNASGPVRRSRLFCSPKGISLPDTAVDGALSPDNRRAAVTQRSSPGSNRVSWRCESAVSSPSPTPPMPMGRWRRADHQGGPVAPLTQPDLDAQARSRLWWLISLPLIRLGARILWRLRVDRDRSRSSFVLAANHYSFLDLLSSEPFTGSGPVSSRSSICMGTTGPGLGPRFLSHHGATGRCRSGPCANAWSTLESGGVVGLFPEGIRVERFGEGFR